MAKIRLKKINLSLRLAFVMLVVFLVAFVLSSTRLHAEVNGQEKTLRLNIVPEFIDGGSDKSPSRWEGISNALFSDLGDTADTAQFTKENSAYITIGDINPAHEPVQDEIAPDAGNGGNAVPAQEPADSTVPSAEPKTETPTAPAESVPADTSGQNEVAPVAPSETPPSEVQPADAGQPTSRLLDLLFGKADWPLASLSTLMSFYQVKSASAQEQPASVPSGAITDEHALVFKGFSVPDDFSDNKIGNVQLRLSLSGLSTISNDSVKIYYSLGGDWEEGGQIDLAHETSNQINNGYYLFGLPVFTEWSELKNLQIKVAFEGPEAADRAVAVFLDGLWLEVDYTPPPQIVDPNATTTDDALLKGTEKKDFNLDLVSKNTDFKTNDKPDFNFLYKRQQGLVGGLVEAVLSTFWDQYGNVKLKAVLKSPSGKEVPVSPSINYVNDGEFNINFSGLPKNFRPGKYVLEMSIEDGDKTYTTTQDFTWGVLAVNTNKTAYLPTETAFLQMAVLDDLGSTVCDADVYLEVTVPDGGVAYMNTDNGLVERNPECGPDNVIDTPDYFAHYGLAGTGEYSVKMIARTAEGAKEIVDRFQVVDSVPFDVERAGPTRIYPVANYPMKLVVKANQDYAGDIVERMPGSFMVASSSAQLNDTELASAVLTDGEGDEKLLTWKNLDIKAGDTVVLTYEMDAPDISPEFYLLGPLSIGEFRELRQWQIASDAVGTFNASAGTNVGSWATIANAWDSVSGSNNTFAVDTVAAGATEWPGKYLKATANRSTSSTGSITKVEIGLEGRVSNTNVGAGFRPMFNSTATGTEMLLSWASANTDVTTYFDVTADAAGPGLGNWTWSDVNNLDIAAYGRNGNGARTFSVDQLYIRVTYDTVQPTGSFNSAVQKTDGTGVVDMSIEVNDTGLAYSKAKIEYVSGSGCNFTTPLDPTIETTDASTTADFGDPKVDNAAAYQIGTSTGWIMTASGSNTVLFDWNSKTNLPNGDGTYCLRLTANDGTFDQAVPATTTLTIDNVNPTAPGQLVATTSSMGNGVELTFGSSTVETNFKEYKIFYKEGTSTVTEGDTLLDSSTEAALGYIGFNGATSTTLNDLNPLTTYSFNIYAYDNYGNESSSTQISITTGKAEPVRANTVSFLAGQYSSSNGTTGQNSDTNQTLPAFDFSLAENGAKIKNAYIVFEAHFEAYANNAGNYTGYDLSFDACQQPCTPAAFSGTGRISKTDNTALAYDETGSNNVRLLLDVTNEAQLAAYKGNGGQLSAEVGYNIKRGTAVNSIAASKAILMVTYQYAEKQAVNLTNTVYYPLESTAAGDSGTRDAVQNDDCTVDSNCPKFGYNMDIPEFGSRLSQWFQTYNQHDGNAAYDFTANVNIEGTNINSASYVYESALNGSQGSSPVVYFYDVNGYAENTAQQLEYHSTSPGATLTYYLLGGEVAETYVASSTAAIKTRTVSFPIGVLNNGLTTVKSNGAADIYFPENGFATGTVSVKKAWVRLISNNYNTGANTVTVSTRTGNNGETAGSPYAYNPAGTVVKPSFNIIHVIPSSDYDELEDANITSPKTVTVYTVNSSNVSQGGMSAELLITYAYASELAGHLTSLNIYGGQSGSAPSQTATATAASLIAPEPLNNKTMLAGGLLSSFLFGDSDAAISTNFTLDSSISTSTPTCTNAFISRTDGVNEFTEYYKSVTSLLPLNNNASLYSCYSNNGGADTSGGGKMNSAIMYTYLYTAPPVKLNQNNWRWYSNSNGLNPVTPRALEKTPTAGINLADVVRLRMNLKVAEEQLATTSLQFKLQYGAAATCTDVSVWYDVGTTSSSTAWRSYDNAAVVDGSSTGSVLLSDSTNFQTYEEDAPTAYNPRPLSLNESGEWDWVLYDNSATSSTDYCFRMVKSDGAALNSYLSYPKITTAASNTPPVTPSALNQSYNASPITSIANGAWLATTSVRLVSQATDVNINESLGLYYQLISNTSTFLTATSAPGSFCGYGTAFGSCASKIWAATSSLGDYRSAAFTGTTSITSLPENYAGYKWQVYACDDGLACSAWNQFSIAPNFYVDTTAPTRPGALTAGDRGATSIVLAFGSSSVESNFSRYRIFYKKGTTTVRETDNEHADSNLQSLNYDLATSTTINTLAAGTTYTFNIWAYDLAGNKSSSSVELIASTTSSFTPPSGGFNTISQKTDGSGAVDIAINANDPDNDDTLRAKIEYEAGASCAFATSTKPTININDASTTATYGDPKVDNAATYQIGTSTGWIMTSLGTNYVFFDWLTKTDLPGVNATYCLRLTLNDGLYDSSSTTRLILIDNVNPATPGNLTAPSKNDTSVTLAFGSQSSDTNFDRYRIFYSTSSPVTESDREWADTNLLSPEYGNATSTKVTGLSADTQYYFNIWAYDGFGNRASATAVSIKTNALPTNPAAVNQYESNGTTIIENGEWTDDNAVVLAARANDPDTSELLTLYYEFVPTTTAFRTATSVPANACAYGTAYNSCASKVWFTSSSSPSNYSATPFYATSSITAIPDSAIGYKWQILACDDDGNCSDWASFNVAVPNVKVDATLPTAPGAMTVNSKTSANVTLNLGTSTTEANFSKYRVFYATSTPVNESGYEYVDSDLDHIDYNGAAMITIPGLDPSKQYYFNIWAYDLAGNKASSTEVSATTNAVQSTPGAAFYIKNSRILYYRVWDGSSWGAEQTGPTLGSAAGDNIRQIDVLRSDDGGKVAILAKTWDGTNQEWWATVYRFAANNFATSSILGTALAAATTNNLITGCIGSLSSGEFFIVRNNNAANGTLTYSWSNVNGWVARGAGPDPAGVVNGCRLTRRPGTDNYVLSTFDNSLDVGLAYYKGGASFPASNAWDTWYETSVNEVSASAFVGETFIDPGDNTRGAVNYSDTTVNTYAYAKNFVMDGTTLSLGSASSSPQTAPDNWNTRFVSGEFAPDLGSTGIAYYAGVDTSNQINVYKIDITNGQPGWATTTNGDNISNGLTYSYANYSQRAYDIAFYKPHYGLVAWTLAASGTPKYRKINQTTNTVDSASSSVPNAGTYIYERVSLYDDPNEDELLAVFQNNANNYNAVFWSGASNAFYSSGNQSWVTIASNTAAFALNDSNVAFSFTSRNSAPNTPTALVQLRSDATTTITNGGWATSTTVYLKGSATDPDTSEMVTLYMQLLGNAGTFTSTTTQPTGACSWGTSFSACTSTIWFVATSTVGDYSITPFTSSVSVTGIPESSTGYKWQLIACDDQAACSNWVTYNATTPNFKVDSIAPTNPNNLTIASKNSYSVTLGLPSAVTEANFSTYKIFYKAGTPVTETDLQQSDSNLGFINFNSATNTRVTVGIASSTQYYFRIWAYDQAGNKSSSTAEVSTTTSQGPILAQTSFLIENDDGANVNSNTASVAASTTLTSVLKGERLNVRLQLENRGGDVMSGKVYKLQYENLSDSPGVWNDVSNASEVAYGLGLSGTNGDAVTSTKAVANGNVWANGTWHEGTNLTNSYTLNNGSYTEFVFALRTNNVQMNKTYRLRLYNSTDSKVIDVYTNYPIFTTVSSDVKRYAKGTYPVLPTGTTDPTYYLDHKGYSDALTDDNSARDPLTSSSEIPVFNFMTKNSTNTQAITATWNGQSTAATSLRNVFLQVYRFGSTNAWVTVASSTSVAANTDFTLTASLNALLSQYHDGSNWTYWRVYQGAGSQTLRTDYATTTFAAAVPEIYQKHFRWRVDNGSESAASWLEAEDYGSPTASSSVAIWQKVRLRMSAANVGGGIGTYRYRIEYATTTGSCATDPGNWAQIPTNNTQPFRLATSSYYVDGAVTTAQLANSEGYSFVAGRVVEDPSNLTASTSLPETYYTENEYVLYPTNLANSGSTYCFRMTNNGTALNGYDRFAELTVAGNPNTAPSFTISPSDNNSATTSPTNYGTAVNFDATADDPEGDDYYLAICKSPGIISGNDAAPTCTGGSWCVSTRSSSTAEASCAYTAATSSESLNWYAYACDHKAGAGVAKCTTMSQGTWGDGYDSPFVINHAPTLSAIWTQTPSQAPGSTFTIMTTSSDPDVIGGADTLNYYVCTTNSASYSGCTAGTVCQALATSSTNVKCSFTDVAPTPATTVTYYGFVFDNHTLPATTNPRISSYSIANVPPTLGSLSLNDGNDITLNLRGGTDKQVSTINTSIVDMNGCQTGLVSANATIYYSAATNTYSCTANDNDCYQITTANCVKSDCVDDNDTTATYTCTAGLKYFANPTDNSVPGNPYEPNNWMSYMRVYDGLNYIATTSAGIVEVKASRALDVSEPTINFGSTLFVGENTGTTTQVSTIYNAGNIPINTNLQGTDMNGNPSGTLAANNMEWDLTPNFTWSFGNDLTNEGVDVNTNIAKPTTTSGSSRKVYWGIGIPFGAYPSAYTGVNTFMSVFNQLGW